MTALQVRHRRHQRPQETPQGIVSNADWKRPGVKYGLKTAHAVLLALLVVVGLGPILWLAKAAITPTQDTLIRPMAVFPHGFAWSNLSDAWTQVDIGLYLWNTIVIAFGALICQLVVASTGAYALSVLRPKWGGVITALLLMTLFVPSVVLLVPLYIEIVHPPLIGGTYVNNYWAIWLPEAAAAFNVLLMKRFFDRNPARDTRGCTHGRRRSVPAVRIDRAPDVKADPRRCVHICGARFVEGLPLAPARPYGREQAAAIGPPANDPGPDRARGVPRRYADRLSRPDHRFPLPPTLVPARDRAQRSVERVISWYGLISFLRGYSIVNGDEHVGRMRGALSDGNLAVTTPGRRVPGGPGVARAVRARVPRPPPGR